MATNPFNLATPLPVETTFLANNGNPNTVYNTSGTPFQNTPVRGVGSQPLTAGGTPAISPWTPANPPASMPVMPTNSAFHNPATQFWQNYAGVVRPVFNLQDSGAWGSNAFAPPPTTTPPTTPPPTTPPTTKPPTTGTGGGGGGADFSGGGGGSLLPGTPLGNWLSTNKPAGDNTTRTAFGFESYEAPQIGAGDLSSPSVRQWLGDIVGETASRLGFNTSQDVIGQALDALIPGNVYQPGAGWNWGNTIVGVLNALIPGSGSLAGRLAEALSNSDWGKTSDSWVARALRNWVSKNDEASLQRWYNNAGVTWDTNAGTLTGTNPWLASDAPVPTGNVSIGDIQNVPITGGGGGGYDGGSYGGFTPDFGGSLSGGGMGWGGGAFTGSFLGGLGIGGGGGGGGGAGDWGPFTPMFAK